MSHGGNEVLTRLESVLSQIDARPSCLSPDLPAAPNLRSVLSSNEDQPGPPSQLPKHIEVKALQGRPVGEIIHAQGPVEWILLPEAAGSLQGYAEIHSRENQWKNEERPAGMDEAAFSMFAARRLRTTNRIRESVLEARAAESSKMGVREAVVVIEPCILPEEQAVASRETRSNRQGRSANQ